MKFKDIKNKDKSELVDDLNKMRNELREMRFKVSSGALKTVRDVRKKRKDIARVLTVLNTKKS